MILWTVCHTCAVHPAPFGYCGRWYCAAHRADGEAYRRASMQPEPSA